MTRPSPQHDDKVRDYFDRRVDAYDAFYDAPSAYQRAFNRIFRKAVYLRRDHTITLAKRFSCKTVLDVGCGSGRNSIYFLHNGIDFVSGIDTSVEMIEEARRVAKEAGVSDRCEFQHVDFMSLPAESRFDLVAALGVFDYVLDADEFLGQMAKHAEKVIYGSFPGWTLVRSPLRKIRYTLRGCPTHFYRRAEIKSIFEGVKFGKYDDQSASSGYLAWAAKT